MGASLKGECSKKVDIPVDLLLLLQHDGTAIADSEETAPGDDFRLIFLGGLALHVLTGCCQAPIESVQVLVDDQRIGVTNADGICVVHTLVGPRQIKLVHGAFGPDGHVMSCEVTQGPLRSETVFAETNVFIYITDPSLDDSIGVDGEEPPPCPSLAWLCCDGAQIPEEALPVKARLVARCTNFHGLSWTFGEQEIAAQRLGLGTAHGTSKPVKHDAGTCVFGELELVCQRAGFVWNAKSPSPLSERMTDMGGCEFLRVLNCPIAMGSLSHL